MADKGESQRSPDSSGGGDADRSETTNAALTASLIARAREAQLQLLFGRLQNSGINHAGDASQQLLQNNPLLNSLLAQSLMNPAMNSSTSALAQLILLNRSRSEPPPRQWRPPLGSIGTPQISPLEYSIARALQELSNMSSASPHLHIQATALNHPRRAPLPAASLSTTAAAASSLFHQSTSSAAAAYAHTSPPAASAFLAHNAPSPAVSSIAHTSTSPAAASIAHTAPPPIAAASHAHTAPSPATGSSKPVTVGRSQVLYVDHDDYNLSPYQCSVRKQIEVFEATEKEVKGDAQGRNRPILLKQVGIRCKHCGKLPSKQRVKGAVFFPSQLVGLYQTAQNMANTHLIKDCTEIPKDLREDLILIRQNEKGSKNKTRKSSYGGGRHYWASCLRVMGVVESSDRRLWFSSSAPPLEQISL
jgi:hypothetical protein